MKSIINLIGFAIIFVLNPIIHLGKQPIWVIIISSLNMLIPIIIICLGAIALFCFLFEKVKAYSLKAVYLKTATSMLFIILGAYCASQSEHRIFAMFTVIGLTLGMIGDICLDLKYVFKEKDYEFTLGGFFAFGLGHISYMLGMYLEFFRNQNPLYIIIPFVIGLVLGPATVFTSKFMKVEYGKIKPVALAYGIIIFSMVASAFSMWIMSGFANRGLMLFAIGGVLFAVSDLILNMTYFAEGHEKPFDLISNGITYYAAQYLIAFSIMFL